MDKFGRVLLVCTAFLAVGAPLAGECIEPTGRSPKPKCEAISPAPKLQLSNARTISGVFVEPWSLPPDKWPSEIDAIARRGLDLIVIAGVQLISEDGRLSTHWPEVSAITKAAKQKNIKVILGLENDVRFSVVTASAASLKKARDTDLGLASMAVADKLPINGWYLAREVHNANDGEKMALMRDKYLEPLAAALHKQHTAILISPHFNPAATKCKVLLSSSATAKAFARLVDGTKVTIVAVQDGVGARNGPGRIGDCVWPTVDEFLTQAAEYGRAIASELPASADLWWNAEAFSQPDATMTRFKSQRRIVPQRATKVVAYEWFAFRDLR